MLCRADRRCRQENAARAKEAAGPTLTSTADALTALVARFRLRSAQSDVNTSGLKRRSADPAPTARNAAVAMAAAR